MPSAPEGTQYFLIDLQKALWLPMAQQVTLSRPEPNTMRLNAVARWAALNCSAIPLRRDALKPCVSHAKTAIGFKLPGNCQLNATLKICLLPN